MSRRQSFWVLLVCIAISLFAVVYPIYVIWPFRAQGARELALALLVTRWRPLVTLLSAVLAVVALVMYWRAQPGRPRRTFAVLGAIVVCASAALARVNIYELMFHPDIHPSFAPAVTSKLDKDEKVIAVRVGDEARAYPIRIIAYHHVINDVVGGTALAATY